jgi:hypothetical protein
MDVAYRLASFHGRIFYVDLRAPHENCALSRATPKGGSMVTTNKNTLVASPNTRCDSAFRKDYECAITLAAAGEGQIAEKTSSHLFRLIRAKFSAEETNAVINWLKHSSGPHGCEITERSSSYNYPRYSEVCRDL